MTFASRCAAVVAARWFQRTVLALVVANAAVIGLETDDRIAAAAGDLLPWAHASFVALFAAELAVRLAATWPRPWRFFTSGWNLFDLLIVLLAFTPSAGAWATVGRLARVLRVARVVSLSPQLRLIVVTLLRSIPSMGHIGLLLGLLLYVYGVMGVHLFREADPAHWGSLGTALLTLFQVLTLEGWVELQRTGLTVSSWAWAFYASFVLIAVFVVVNLFVAVVLNNLERARRETEGDDDDVRWRRVFAELAAVRAALPPAGSTRPNDGVDSFDSTTGPGRLR